MLRSTIGKVPVVKSRVSIWVPSGRRPRTSPSAALSSSKLVVGLTPSEKVTSTSAVPRVVVERTSDTPITPYAASSSGRVMATIICSAGRSPASAMMMARLKVISGNTELGIEKASHTPSMVNPTTASIARMEFDRVTSKPALPARLLDPDFEPVGERVAARGDDEIARREARSHLHLITVANPERDRHPMRAIVLAHDEDIKTAVVILEQRGGGNHDRIGHRFCGYRRFSGRAGL